MANAEEAIPFGPQLRRRRIALGLTQEVLAERTGLGVRSIQHLEAGAHLPHRETINRLVRVLELSGEERRQFERTAQPPPRPREAVSLPPGEVTGDSARQFVAGHNLPAQLTSFVGREQELADVTRLLRAHRLVTLTGTGGCGKTRLALQVASGLGDDFPDGVWLIELAPLVDPHLVLQTVATAVGVHEHPHRPRRDTLVDALRSKHLLLILDNCEHLVEACASLTEGLLRVCPTVRILATSREALGIAGEVPWRVPSLPVPPSGELPSLDQISQYAAVRLFAERAAVVDAGFPLTARSVLVVGQIVRRLDGIPLAIELAAARTNVLAVERIAARLDDQFRLLTGGSRTALPRQKTLKATIDWSYDLLSEPEQCLLRRLSVFVGGWSLEAAESVCSDTEHSVPITPSDVLDLLTLLVAKSLVQVEKREGEERYRLLEALRQYGRDRLIEAAESEQVRERHRNWFLDLAERGEPELIGPRQGEWLDRLALEIDNLRAAWEWSIERGPTELGLRLAGAMGQFWVVRDYSSEGRGWLVGALAAPKAWEHPAARAKALDALGIILAHLDIYDEMGRVYEECLRICQEVGDRRRAAWAARQLGIQAVRLRDLGRAEVLLSEALARAREIDDGWLLAQVLEGLGLAVADRGDFATSQRLLAESLEHFRSTGDWRAIGNSLMLLGRAASEQGDQATARDCFADGLAAWRALGSQSFVSMALCLLGMQAALEGELDRGRTLVDKGLALARERGERWVITPILTARALLARADGERARAQKLVAEAIQVATEGGLGSQSRARALGVGGALAVDQGDYRRGVHILGAAAARRVNPLELHPGEYQAAAEARALARASIGDEAADAAWAEGQAMSVEDAIAHALREDTG